MGVGVGVRALRRVVMRVARVVLPGSAAAGGGLGLELFVGIKGEREGKEREREVEPEPGIPAMPIKSL